MLVSRLLGSFGRKQPARSALRFTFIAALCCNLPLLTHAQKLSSKPDLSTLVVMGDSLSAGVQNISLEGSQQSHGYATVIAEQAKLSNYVMPLILPPGMPNKVYI